MGWSGTAKIQDRTGRDSQNPRRDMVQNGTEQKRTFPATGKWCSKTENVVLKQEEDVLKQEKDVLKQKNDVQNQEIW